MLENDGWSGGLVTSAQADEWVRERRDAPGAVERGSGLIPVAPVAEPYQAHLERIGLTWSPECAPLYTADGMAVAHKAIRHPVSKHVFGVVGMGYSVLGWEHGAMLQPIVDAGIAAWDGILLLRNGGMAVVRSRLAQELRIPGDDSVIRGHLSLVIPIDGSAAMRFLQHQGRIVCENTYRMAVRQATASGHVSAIRHTKHARSRVSALKRAVMESAQGMAALQAFGERAARYRLSAPQLETIVSRVFPGKREADGTVTVTRYQEAARDKVRALYDGEALGTTGANKGTAWQAVNAVTEYADHFTRMRKENDTPENRMESALFGRAHAIKSAAFEVVEDVMGELV